jgi:hypothetical protein
MASKKQVWFANKRNGYGWRPASWQGWACVGVYTFYTAFITVWFLSSAVIRTADVLVYLGLMTFGLGCLIWISMEYAEKPKWRWGKKK